MINSWKNIVHQASFEQGKELFALVDAAKIDEIPALFFDLEEDPEYFSLFFETPQEELFDVAPYLIRLSADSDFLAWLLNEGWGQSWGIFIVTEEADIEVLFEHFRQFLKVEDPEGNRLFFRFYDPRVLRIFLPTCNAKEVFDFFGEVVDEFLVEADEEDNLLSFKKSEIGLNAETFHIFRN